MDKNTLEYLSVTSPAGVEKPERKRRFLVPLAGLVINHLVPLYTTSPSFIPRSLRMAFSIESAFSL
ncbi:MAG: hypothetical protein ACPGRR_09810, partial [Pseudoalteromonas shioyasakiensis]